MSPVGGPESRPKPPLLAFYGDDFTGASENLAQLHRHGLTSFMFLRCPNPERFREVAKGYEAIGIAGIARALPPDAMAVEIEPPLRLFAEAGIRLIQYKLCSTFDSSPTRGNLATALAIGRRVLGLCFPPVFAATPEFGRYTAFGNHFARFGPAVDRLDRHPVMSRHPATPMGEADLRRVLADQGCPGAGLVDLSVLGQGVEAVLARAESERGGENRPVVFDGLADDDCALVAEAVWRMAAREPVYALAAQGLAHGLGRFLKGRPASRSPPVEALASAAPLLVLSGSCSPVTAAQIEAFEAAGALALRLRPALVIDAASRESALDDAAGAASAAFATGRSACIYTALGPDDPEAGPLRDHAARLRLDPSEVARRVGQALGRLAELLIARHGLARVVFAGGDTSSFALGRLGPEGLSVASGDYRSGAHVFRLMADGAADGLEVVLKGGQVGAKDIFVALRDGRVAS